MNFDLVETFFLSWIVPQMLLGMVLLATPATRLAARQLLTSASSGVLGRVLFWSVPCFFLFPFVAWLVPALKPMETWVLMWTLQASVLAMLRWVGAEDSTPQINAPVQTE